MRRECHADVLEESAERCEVEQYSAKEEAQYQIYRKDGREDFRRGYLDGQQDDYNTDGKCQSDDGKRIQDDFHRRELNACSDETMIHRHIPARPRAVAILPRQTLSKL